MLVTLRSLRTNECQNIATYWLDEGLQSANQVALVEIRKCLRALPQEPTEVPAVPYRAQPSA